MCMAQEYHVFLTDTLVVSDSEYENPVIEAWATSLTCISYSSKGNTYIKYEITS